MFEGLYKDIDNLLFYYFSKTLPEPSKSEQITTERILIQQANTSQKIAITNALKNRISIIEGPPGTGKTSTILNIISNLVYRNKKTLIVSKNNSAIDNVVEELARMNLPNYYIRLR